MVKRKKTTPKVAGDAATFKAELERKGNPDVKFLTDLDKYDRSEIYGKDPNKHYYWGKEKDIGFHETQGYTKSDGKGLKIQAPGGTTFWAPEGVQSGKKGEGLILLEMPKERYKLREKYRDLRNKELTQDMDKQLKEKTVRGVNPEEGGVFTPEGDFLKDLGG
jgi:hypothetical protein